MPDKRRRLATVWPEALNASIVVFISIDIGDEGEAAAAVHAFKYPSEPRRDTDCERELHILALPQLYDDSLALLLLLRAHKEAGERALARLLETPIIKLPVSDPSALSEGDVDLAERA